MKTIWIQLIAGLAMFVLCISVCTTTTNATEGWSDNFNDGDFDGWTICENPVISSGSNWNATSNCLKLDQYPHGGLITHPSTVAYGTWSFDFKADETQVRTDTMAAIDFISSNVHDVDDYGDLSAYWVQFIAGADDNFGISLRKQHGGVLTVIDSNETRVPAADWHHIHVTRTEAGLFSVYHNGSLIMQEADTEIDTSELFAFFPGQYCGFAVLDNVAVHDDVLPPPPPTTTTTSTTTTSVLSDWLPIGIGVSAVVIIAVVVIVRKRT
jgi:hypothetical protein